MTRSAKAVACSSVTQHEADRGGVASTMADHEDSFPLLGSSEAACVEYPCRSHVTQLCQRTDDGEHVSSVVGLEESHGILDDDPSRAGVVDDAGVLVDESGELVEVAASLAGEAGSVRRSDAGVLAGEASDGSVDPMAEVTCSDIDDVS
jgi:hypothetical protein